MIDKEYVTKLEDRLSSLESEMVALSGDGHSARMRGVLEEHARLVRLRDLAQAYMKLVSDLAESQSILEEANIDDDLKELAENDKARIEKALPGAERELKMALLPPDPAEQRNIIMEIRAGTGGEEAALFAADLYRMYGRYADSMGWKTGMIDASASSIGGYKEVVFTIEGTDVYRRMQYESGVHRVQRIPVTEAGGRIHTSAATVAVLPEAEEVDEIEIRTEDLRIDVYRSSGAGGQHVNTTDSAVRITHLPSGIVTQSQDERSQHRNRDKAMRVLKARLLDHSRQEEEARTADARRSQIGSGDRSERIRTYNYPQNRVTDHRINLTLYSLDRIMEGLLDELIGPLIDFDVEQRLAKEMKV